MTVRGEMRITAFELAQWFAYNWWRLRWEPPKYNASWRDSHRLTAIGGGSVWPDIIFASDMQAVTILSTPTENIQYEPIQYITPKLETRIPADAFERGVDDFLDLTARRLRDLQVNDSDAVPFLELLEVLRVERSDPEVASYRQVEAALGFDADDAPERLIQVLGSFAEKWGEDGVREIAAASPPSGAEALTQELGDVHLPNVRVSFESLKGMEYGRRRFQIGKEEPWRLASVAAKKVRAAWNLGDGKLDSQSLAKHLDAPLDRLLAYEPSKLPLGVARNSKLMKDWEATFRKRNPTSRRFEICRLIGDYLIAPLSESLLPMTDARTARQRFQRSFAQELLAPVDGLADIVGQNADDDSVENAASYFEVSPHLVVTALVNRRMLDRSYLPHDF